MKKEQVRNIKKGMLAGKSIAGVILAIIMVFAIYAIVSDANKFELLDVKVELGEKISKDVRNYVEITNKKVSYEEMELYTDDVDNNKVGTYKYHIVYEDVQYEGKIDVVDTKAPVFMLKDVTIKKGKTFEAADFVDVCEDPSGCNYSFVDSNVTEKYTDKGNYKIMIAVTDAYQNTEMKEANLIIK